MSYYLLFPFTLISLHFFNLTFYTAKDVDPQRKCIKIDAEKVMAQKKLVVLGLIIGALSILIAVVGG